MTIAPGIDISTEQIAELCRRYQVREMAVFGSAARGELRPDSDIDVLVELQPDHHLGLFEFDDLQTQLARFLDARWIWCRREGSSHGSAPGCRARQRSSMQRDRALLDDMIEAAASIGAIIAETGFERYRNVAPILQQG